MKMRNSRSSSLTTTFIYIFSYLPHHHRDIHGPEQCLHSCFIYFFFLYLLCFFLHQSILFPSLYQHHRQTSTTTTTTIIKTEATNYASSKISNGYLIGCNEYCSWLFIVTHVSKFFYRFFFLHTNTTTNTFFPDKWKRFLNFEWWSLLQQEQNLWWFNYNYFITLSTSMKSF